MSDLDAAYSSFAADHGLEAVAGFPAGPLTPLLVESGSGQLAPAARGQLGRREVMPVFTANRMQPGLVLPAYANPEDPDDFILVW